MSTYSTLLYFVAKTTSQSKAEIQTQSLKTCFCALKKSTSNRCSLKILFQTLEELLKSRNGATCFERTLGVQLLDPALSKPSPKHRCTFLPKIQPKETVEMRGRPSDDLRIRHNVIFIFILYMNSYGSYGCKTIGEKNSRTCRAMQKHEETTKENWKGSFSVMFSL